jgi:hypothetical protein
MINSNRRLDGSGDIYYWRGMKYESQSNLFAKPMGI